MLWIVIGVVVFIIGTLLTRSLGGGVLAVVGFILWRFGLLGPVVSWIVRIARSAYNYVRAIIEVIKDEFSNASDAALVFISTKVDFVMGVVII
ncbi:hypothetical protein [Litchfieldia alkalitelluris]|uniref:hypothetical protein n=1 Tax=Litchfieldia alkalitelluris TaxID=304268 RepID=UPI0009988DD5|nr:hypothetical protein [Litchfieldia alkalitelluris]